MRGEERRREERRRSRRFAFRPGITRIRSQGLLSARGAAADTPSDTCPRLYPPPSQPATPSPPCVVATLPPTFAATTAHRCNDRAAAAQPVVLSRRLSLQPRPSFDATSRRLRLALPEAHQIDPVLPELRADARRGKTLQPLLYRDNFGGTVETGAGGMSNGEDRFTDLGEPSWKRPPACWSDSALQPTKRPGGVSTTSTV